MSVDNRIVRVITASDKAERPESPFPISGDRHRCDGCGRPRDSWREGSPGHSETVYSEEFWHGVCKTCWAVLSPEQQEERRDAEEAGYTGPASGIPASAAAWRADAPHRRVAAERQEAQRREAERRKLRLRVADDEGRRDARRGLNISSGHYSDHGEIVAYEAAFKAEQKRMVVEIESALRDGILAREQGLSIAACPYQDRPGAWSITRKRREAWLAGFRSNGRKAGRPGAEKRGSARAPR